MPTTFNTQPSPDTDLAAFEAAAARIDPQATLVAMISLTGGASAQVQVLTLQRPDGSAQQVVLRRHGVIDRTANPQIASDEFRLLTLLQARGLPVAAPVGVDATGESSPDGIPWIAVTYVEGSTTLAQDDLPTALPQMAATLVTIHQVPGDLDTLAFLPPKGLATDAPPSAAGYPIDDSMHEPAIRAALAAGATTEVPTNRTSLLHGDYWPGNFIWRGGQLAAVLDWEDACSGDPLADVGIARLELGLHYNDAATETFTEHYRQQADAAGLILDWQSLPWWDLRAALRMCGRIGEWGLAAEEEARMRAQHTAFTQRALAAVGQPLRAD